ncbi:MAG TPA: tetratricopeptide repeat protein [Pyrinomonadaceae bacterium]
MTDWLRPLLLMFYAPTRGMGVARDRAPLGPAAVLALASQAALLAYVLWPYLFAGGGAVWNTWGMLSVLSKAAQSVLFLAVGFVPVAVFVANLFERRGSFGVALEQEYASVASAVFYVRAAASLLALPLAVLSRVSGFEATSLEGSRQNYALLAERGYVGPEFLSLMLDPVTMSEGWASTLATPFLVLGLLIAFREVFRFSWPRAAAALLVSAPLTFLVGLVLAPLFNWVLGSPLLLIIFLLLMRGYIGEVMRGQRARTSFRQNLEAATLNPADASAHYNLGLIHLNRKELTAARERFERAIDIDAEEIDAHYQLGRIARAEGRLSDAIKHFEQVVVRDEAHAQQEIWREIGATYVHAGQFADAEGALERFLDKRQSDPEGLYLMGRAYFGQGRLREAKEWMQRCVEAVRTAPAYKYRTEKRWLNEAQQFLRTQA